MSRLSKRHRMLGGVLLTALSFLAGDWYLKTGEPAKAQGAAHGSGGAGGSGAIATRWEDVSGLVAQLTDTHYTSVADELASVDRDLFVPTAVVEEAFPVVEPVLSEAEEAAAAPPPAPPPSFEEVHRLVGVMIGAHPLAVIDDLVVPVGGVVDGHELVEVQRDYVVLKSRETGLLVRLTVASSPVNP
ncbi:MAG: hypothetical protein PVJ57_18010 [Phycisphaerae bacterium]|jgi:hypothetical protein